MDTKQLIQKAKILAPFVINAAKHMYQYTEKNLGQLETGSQEEKHLKFDCLFFFLLVADILTFGAFGNTEARNTITDNLYWTIIESMSEGIEDKVFFRDGVNVLYEKFSQDMQGFTLFSDDKSRQLNKLLQWQFAKRILQTYGRWPGDMIFIIQFAGVLNEEIEELNKSFDFKSTL